MSASVELSIRQSTVCTRRDPYAVLFGRTELQDRVLLWNAAALELIRELVLDEHMGSVTCLAFEPPPNASDRYSSRVPVVPVHFLTPQRMNCFARVVTKCMCLWWWRKISSITRSDASNLIGMEWNGLIYRFIDAADAAAGGIEAKQRAAGAMHVARGVRTAGLLERCMQCIAVLC